MRILPQNVPLAGARGRRVVFTNARRRARARTRGGVGGADESPRGDGVIDRRFFLNAVVRRLTAEPRERRFFIARLIAESAAARARSLGKSGGSNLHNLNEKIGGCCSGGEQPIADATRSS